MAAKSPITTLNGLGRYRHTERATYDYNAERSKREGPPDRRANHWRYLEDRSTIAFAGFIERELGGLAPPPIEGALSSRRSHLGTSSLKLHSKRVSPRAECSYSGERPLPSVLSPRISIGSRRTLPGIISSLPCEMSRMTWSTSAAGDIFALLTVRVAGVSTSGGSTSTTRIPTPRNCRRSASVKEWRPA
jgi:hypothetical protein